MRLNHYNIKERELFVKLADYASDRDALNTEMLANYEQAVIDSKQHTQILNACFEQHQDHLFYGSDFANHGDL